MQDIKSACRIWGILGEGGGMHIAACVEGAVYVAKSARLGCKVLAAAALGAIFARTENLAGVLATVEAIPGLVFLARDGSDMGKTFAIVALVMLAKNDALASAVVAAGGIPVLVCQGETGEDEYGRKMAVAGALMTLSSKNDDNCVAIADAGGIPVLVALAHDGDDDDKAFRLAYAAGTLLNLSTNVSLTAAIVRAGAVAVLTALERDGEGNGREWASQALENLAEGGAAEGGAVEGGAVEGGVDHIEP